MAEPKLETYTIAEYLAREERALEKSDYDNGRIIHGMSGGTFDHGIIIGNANYALKTAISAENMACVAVTSEVRLYIEAYNSFVYPDGMLLCGEVEFASQDPLSVTNPTLVIEVLSRSSEGYDRGEKFRKYRSLVSFREYVMIDSRRPVVEVMYRKGPGEWSMATAIGLDNTIYVHSLAVEISLRELYAGTLRLNTDLSADEAV